MKRKPRAHKQADILKTICFTLIMYWFTLYFNPHPTASASTMSIQDQIDAAEPGETILIEEGQYSESLMIDKAIHLKGQGQVDISSSKQPAITIVADHVQLENLSLTMKKQDKPLPALLIRSHHNIIEQLQIHTDSYGIQLGEAHHNTIEYVDITGDEILPVKERKHGVDIQRSHYNNIRHTTITSVQDGIYIEKSRQTTIQNNDVIKSRYGYHLMFTEGTIVQHNRAAHNMNGLMVMGASKPTIQENTLIDHQQHSQSLGLLVFDTTDATIVNNHIQQNRIGILIENAQANLLSKNTIQANYIGIQLKEASKNTIEQNAFISNLAQGQALGSSLNKTNGNYWSDHIGLDITGDHRSNLTYTVHPFWLNITDNLPSLQLLFQAPGMHFLEVMIQTPEQEQLVDKAPLMNHPLTDGHQIQHTKKTFAFILCFILLSISIGLMYIGGRINEKN